MKARRRSAAALTVAGGTLLALLVPGPATAQSGREVSGGYVSWSTGESAASGLRLEGAGGSAGRAWFRAAGGEVDAGRGEVDLAGTAGFTDIGAPAPELRLGGLRLTLDQEGGALYARRLDAETAEFTLADVVTGDARPVVREGGATWTGLRLSLTEEGARLFADWSGRAFAAGDALGLLDVTVGTGEGAPEPSPAAPGGPAVPEPSPVEPAPPEETDVPRSPDPAVAPTATVAAPVLSGGGEQRVSGEGFTPGEVVLVAVDGDTRYQAVADERRRVTRSFPVYANAAAGRHTVTLTPVTGAGGSAEARFEVRGPDGSTG
ncbi:HtaA domain-containing protein [Streptomyces sp. NPDC091377]|uniref:HtaA domain-containing protein n=1 Tax=Streptomyces sp. NPDC091377 TaxID=3365995 RepID=UPI00382C7C3C